MLVSGSVVVDELRVPVGSQLLGRMEKKMEATIVYWGHIGDNGKENGSYYSILGSYWG